MSQLAIRGFDAYRRLVDLSDQRNTDDLTLLRVAGLDGDSEDLTGQDLREADKLDIRVDFLIPDKPWIEQRTSIEDFIMQNTQHLLGRYFTELVQKSSGAKVPFLDVLSGIGKHILSDIYWKIDESPLNAWANVAYSTRTHDSSIQHLLDHVELRSRDLPLGGTVYVLGTHSPMAHFNTSVYQTEEGTTLALVHESTGQGINAITVVLPAGEKFEAGFDDKSKAEDYAIYAALVVSSAAYGLDIVDAPHLMNVDSALEQLTTKYAFTQLKCTPQDVGCMDMDMGEHHGADLLYLALLSGFQLTDSLAISDGFHPLWEIFDGYKYAVHMPSETEWPPVPTIQYSLDGTEATHYGMSAYRFLLSAMQLIKPHQWHVPWMTKQSITSVDAMLESVDEYYLKQWDRSEIHDHILMHPEILLNYREQKEMPLAPIQIAFLEGELSAPIHKLKYSNICHAMETLGLLLAEESLTWTQDQQNKVRTWVRRVMDGHFTGWPDMTESYHLYRGLKLIAQHHDKIGL